jgi:hypothetical protein
VSGAVERLETLLRNELAGPRGRTPQITLWRRRVALWQSLRLHWLQWERLLATSDLPAAAVSLSAPLSGAVQALTAHVDDDAALQPPDPPPPPRDAWARLARESDRSLLTLLALGEEQRPLLAASRQQAELRLAANANANANANAR